MRLRILGETLKIAVRVDVARGIAPGKPCFCGRCSTSAVAQPSNQGRPSRHGDSQVGKCRPRLTRAKTSDRILMWLTAHYGCFDPRRCEIWQEYLQPSARVDGRTPVVNEIEEAMSIGRENQEFIALGQAWCAHLRIDRSGVGVGLVEEATGLPISGGRFACDFAASRGGFGAMQLSGSAVDFYENNCRGCQHRSPGGRIPNLGTWAEERLSERAEQQRAGQTARQLARDQAQGRADHRRLVSASFSAECQAVVELINRVDADIADTEAGQSLLESARLTPGSFPAEIEQMLLMDSRRLRSRALLGVLVQLASAGTGDSAEMRSLCIDAVRDGWARDEACTHLSRHGTADDVSDRFLDGVIARAAPPVAILRSERGEPGALIHYYSVAPEPVQAKLSEMLRHGDAWTRARAAAGVSAVISVDSETASRLLPALLDGLRHDHDRHDHSGAKQEVTSAVSEVLHGSPTAFAEEVRTRWPRATAEYRARMMSCLDAAVHRLPSGLSAEAAEVVLNLSIWVLSEPHDRRVSGYEANYQGRAADALTSIVRVVPAGLLSSDALFGLLLTWLDREREFSGVQLSGPIAELEHMSISAQLRRYIRDIADSIVAAGTREPSTFVRACKELYEGADSSPSVRAQVVRIASRMAASSPSQVNEALPLAYGAMLGDDQIVRAAGMRAAGDLFRALPPESVPPLLAEAAAVGLADEFLIVVDAAVEAMSEIPGDLIDRGQAILRIAAIAWGCAPDHARDYVVRHAMTAARHLVDEDERARGGVRPALLRAIGRMPAHNAREMLSRQRWLEEDEGWPDAAIHALRLDDDLQFEIDHDRDALLERLARRRLDMAQIAALKGVLLGTCGNDHHESLIAADVLAEIGSPDAAAEVIAAYLETIPDTIEMRDLRRYLTLAALRFQTEAAIALADTDARYDVRAQLQQWRDTQ